MSMFTTVYSPCSAPAVNRPKLRLAKRARGTYQLTRGGAVCFAAIGIIALASLNTGNNLLFMILAVVGAGVVISAVISRVILSGIQIDLAFPQRVFAQDRVRAAMTIHNARRRAPVYAISVDGSEGKAEARTSARMKMQPFFVPYLPPQSSLYFEADFTFQGRGLYSLISLGISSCFPFGVLRRKQAVCLEDGILVFPAIGRVEAAKQPVNGRSVGLGTGQLGHGGDLYAIRPYRDGDPARHIDWKATAKTGEIKVREFTREAGESVAIFLDCRMAAPIDGEARARFERAVSFCASLACESLTTQASLQFAGGGTLTRPEQGQPALDAVLSALAVIEPDTSAEKEEMVPLNILFTASVPLVVTDRPGNPMFSAASAAGRVIAMSELREADIPPNL